jgi:hypothetical protein
MDTYTLPYLENEQIYICSILEKWTKLKQLDGKERNKYLKHFKNKEAKTKLYKFHSNIFCHLIEKLAETGFEILVAGSSVIGSFPPYNYQPNDFDFYVKNLNNQKIIEIDKKIRETFTESKIIIFRKLITITWWIFNPEMTQLHMTIQLNTFQIDSWADLFIIYHSDFLCIGFEIKSNKFVYFTERFNPTWLFSKPEYSWGTNILTFDVDISLTNVIKKYKNRDINIKMVEKNKYLTKKFIFDTYFKDILDIKEIEHSINDNSDNTDNNDNTELLNENIANQIFDDNDDELEFSTIDIINLNIEIEPELYQRYNLDLILGKNDDNSTSNSVSDNNNLESLIDDNEQIEKSSNMLIYINGDIPSEILNNMMERINKTFGFNIIFQNEENIKKFVKDDNINLYDSLSNYILDKQSPNYLMTWRYFYQIIRQRFNYNIYRLKDSHIDKFKNAYRKQFAVSIDINDLLYDITMPPLINLIMFKHKYNDTYIKLTNILNNHTETIIDDNNTNYELCPILFNKQRIFISGQCNHQFSLHAYLMSFSTSYSIINCPLCRCIFSQIKIVFYPLTTISKLDS